MTFVRSRTTERRQVIAPQCPFRTQGRAGFANSGQDQDSSSEYILSIPTSQPYCTARSLQTIFWNSTVRLCDCPGLVCPSFAGMERQVLSGILPIQNVGLSLCSSLGFLSGIVLTTQRALKRQVEPILYFIAQRMPLENILKLRHPDFSEFALDDDVPRWTA